MIPKGLEIQTAALEGCRRNIETAVRDFWETALIQHYTRHGIDHSERIIDALGSLLIDYPSLLNDYECFVLISAAYLHDIGMQSPTHAGLPLKIEYSLDEMNKIRENHNISSAKMIEESVSGKLKITFGLGECKEFAKSIAIISKYHRNIDINQLKDSSIAGKEIKLPLLASLLRLADELDSDYRRVNMKKLMIKDIPMESKYHWWCHYYVQSIYIKSGCINIFFRFPEEYRDSTLENLLKQKTVDSIHKHLSDVYDVFYRSGIKIYPEPKICSEDYQLDGILYPLPEDLKEYILSKKMGLHHLDNSDGRSPPAAQLITLNTGRYDPQDTKIPIVRPDSIDPLLDKRRLRDVIIKAFSIEDIELLCANVQQDLAGEGIDLQVSLDMIGGSSKPAKVLYLINYLDRRGLLNFLINAVHRERPEQR